MIRIRLRVKEVATEKGVSMSRLSHLTFLAMSTVQSIYRDPFRPVSTETLQRIANALEVSVHDLFEEVPDETEKKSMD